MSRLIEIQSQMALLKKEEDEIKAREFDQVVQEILEKMQSYGITLKDLEGVRRRAPKSVSTSSKPAAAKFTGPNGESWSGRGLTPRWLSALLAQGRTKEEFAINKP